MAPKQRQVRIEQRSALAAMQQLETRSDDELENEARQGKYKAAANAISPNSAEITSRPICEPSRSEKYAATTRPAERCRIVIATRVDMTQRWTLVRLVL